MAELKKIEFTSKVEVIEDVACTAGAYWNIFDLCNIKVKNIIIDYNTARDIAKYTFLVKKMKNL
jgi:hypothetical protein